MENMLFENLQKKTYVMKEMLVRRRLFNHWLKNLKREIETIDSCEDIIDFDKKYFERKKDDI